MLLLSAVVLLLLSLFTWRPVSGGRIEISVPEPQSRNQHRCELYERELEVSGDVGCELVCIMDGYFGEVQISDEQPRRARAACRPKGHYCRNSVESRLSGFNVTFSYGRCNEHCQCVPVDSSEYQHTPFQKDLRKHIPYSSRTYYDGNIEVSNLRITVPPIGKRNATGCEPYESAVPNPSVFTRNSDDDCKKACQIVGVLGQVEIRGDMRIVKETQSDMTKCKIHARETNKVSVFGTRYLLPGKCMAGACVPVHLGSQADDDSGVKEHPETEKESAEPAEEHKNEKKKKKREESSIDRKQEARIQAPTEP